MLLLLLLLLVPLPLLYCFYSSYHCNGNCDYILQYTTAILHIHYT